jgi:hypothetical protein
VAVVDQVARDKASDAMHAIESHEKACIEREQHIKLSFERGTKKMDDLSASILAVDAKIDNSVKYIVKVLMLGGVATIGFLFSSLMTFAIFILSKVKLEFVQ